MAFPQISKLWQFHHLNIFVNHPDLVEKVLMSKSCLQRPLLLLQFFDVDEGLLSSRCKFLKTKKIDEEPVSQSSYSSAMVKRPTLFQNVLHAEKNRLVHDVVFPLCWLANLQSTRKPSQSRIRSSSPSRKMCFARRLFDTIRNGRRRCKGWWDLRKNVRNIWVVSLYDFIAKEEAVWIEASSNPYDFSFFLKASIFLVTSLF